MHLGHRHLLKRRVTTAPRSARLVRAMDTIVICASFIGIVITLDQARIIWVEHNAQGVSLATWGFYVISSLIWLSYGYVHKDRVISTIFFFWILVNGIIVAGILMYGR